MMKVRAIKCSICGDVVFSRSLHDCRDCSCGAISVDGGQGEGYSRVNFPSDTEPPEYFDYTIRTRKKDVLMLDYSKSINKYGLIPGVRKVDILNAFDKHLLQQGRMISHSKSSYCDKNPGHIVVFNAAIALEGFGVIWNGDLDLTLDVDRLEEVSKDLKHRKIYVFSEMIGNDDVIGCRPDLLYAEAGWIIGGYDYGYPNNTQKR